MNALKAALLGTLLAAAGPSHAAARRCPDGKPLKLSGDLFSPVDCSTAAKTAPFLPDLPVGTSQDAKTGLRDLDGLWAGALVHALGRYELLLTVKTNAGGKTELILDAKELQFHERLTDRLSLRPSKQRGAYEAVLTSSLAPDASLEGGALIGAAAEPALSTPPAKAPARRQGDLLFANGAAHRVIFTLTDKDTLDLRAFSAIPGAPLQKFELTLARAKRQAP